ncbi:methionine ABC transporter permease [Reyranella sp. CPCC 100927]|uniref:methionine ABC transporter permease n=1 Tax=Reyranella sp. CPCC 100927 TaxID=2599616 RepID=UPI0011B6ABFD|nr:methionine ABC transporter permease [Reyranella sp. CPCC 100927]TWT04091.1 ABC transporter permease [Reyranella sp. CPCC 100927]
MSPRMIELLLEALLETVVMVGAAGAVAIIAGLPLGVLLLITGKGHILANRPVNFVVGALVNAVRSTPFIILLVAIVPLTRLIAGTSIGTQAAIVPLAIAATPFVARLFETAMREVDPGLVHAAQAMGASRLQIVLKVLIPEARPGLLAAATVMLIGLIGYSAMAGAIGGGGLGDLGVRYGYQRFLPEVMAAVVIVLIVLVQGVQSLGDILVRRFTRR